MDKKTFLNCIKTSCVGRSKSKNFAPYIRKVLEYEKKLNSQLFTLPLTFKTPKQLEAIYKKKIFNCKINFLSTQLWQLATNKIGYSVLSWDEHDFVYKVMPMLQKVLFNINASSLSWHTHFMNLVSFINDNGKKISKTSPKAIDWQLVIFINTKLISLFKTPGKKREQQAYGYIKFLLDVFIDSGNFNQLSQAVIEKKISKLLDSFIKALLALHKQIYSRASALQIDSKGVIDPFLRYLRRFLLVKTTFLPKKMFSEYFLLLISNLESEKPKRFNLKDSSIILLLVDSLFSTLTYNNLDIEEEKIDLFLEQFKSKYVDQIGKYDSYESIIIIHLVIAAALLNGFMR